MKKVHVREDRAYAAAILLVGFMVYGFVCLPAITRRGYPEISPFLLAMPWLWPAPILLSAPLVRFGRSRIATLAAYMVGVALVFGGVVGYAVPRSVTIGDAALQGAMLALPMLVLGSLPEGLARGFLRLIGVRHLPEPATETAVDPEEMAAAASIPGRVRTYLAVVAVTAVLFPFAYHRGSLAVARWQGARAAERNWAAGEAWWAVMRDEPEWDPGAQHTYDPRTGLRIHCVRDDLVYEAWWRSYRKVIRRKLAEHGPAPMVRNLFTEQQLRELIGRPDVRRVVEFPFTWGDVRIDAPGPWAGRPPALYVAVVQRKEEVLVHFAPHWGGVYQADGTRIQHFPHELEMDLFAALEERFSQPHAAKGGVP